MPIQEKTSRIWCNHCRTVSHHRLLISHGYNDLPTDEYPYPDYGWYEVHVCLGCDHCVLEHHSQYGMALLENGERAVSVTYHPDRNDFMHIARNFNQLPMEIDWRYRECSEAFNKHLGILCSMGLRSLIECVCVDKNIAGRNLKEKIDSLADILPENIVQNLHEFRFMGNEAAHEIGSTGHRDLKLALDIIDDLLNFLYDLDYKTDALTNPKRLG